LILSLFMIGFFDSWFGWVQTMKYFHNLYPEYDYMFFADNKNCPFWVKTWPEITEITFNSLNWLFDNWAKIVIVACNTAAAYSIRKRQSLYPEKKTLSITVPWIEEIIATRHLETDTISWPVAVLATQATVRSDIYTDLYTRFWWKGEPSFHFIMAPKLVDMVESGVEDKEQIKSVIQEYLNHLPKRISTLVLWCTHFSVYKKYFEELFDGVVIDPSLYSAKRFGEYLKNHPEITSQLSKDSTVKFYTTWDTVNFDKIGSNLCWNFIKSKKVDL